MPSSKTITEEQRLQALGLLTVIQHLQRQIDTTIDALAKTVGHEAEYGGGAPYFGRLSDAAMEVAYSTPLGELTTYLTNEGVTVEGVDV